MSKERVAVTMDAGRLALARNMASQTDGNLSAYIDGAVAARLRADGASGVAALLDTPEGRDLAADMARGTAALDQLDQLGGAAA